MVAVGDAGGCVYKPFSLPFSHQSQWSWEGGSGLNTNSDAYRTLDEAFCPQRLMIFKSLALESANLGLGPSSASVLLDGIEQMT